MESNVYIVVAVTIVALGVISFSYIRSAITKIESITVIEIRLKSLMEHIHEVLADIKKIVRDSHELDKRLSLLEEECKILKNEVTLLRTKLHDHSNQIQKINGTLTKK